MFLKKKDVCLGFVEEQELRQLRLMDSVTLGSINKFWNLEKIFGRTPMKPAVPSSVCFQPKQMVSEQPDQLKEKLKKLIHDLIYLNQVTTTLAENSLSQ